jgi:hypothetical protein
MARSPCGSTRRIAEGSGVFYQFPNGSCRVAPVNRQFNTRPRLPTPPRPKGRESSTNFQTVAVGSRQATVNSTQARAGGAQRVRSRGACFDSCSRLGSPAVQIATPFEDSRPCGEQEILAEFGCDRDLLIVAAIGSQNSAPTNFAQPIHQETQGIGTGNCVPAHVGRNENSRY